MMQTEPLNLRPISSPSLGLRLRQIEAVLAKFGRPLGETAPALSFHFGRRGWIDNLFDYACGQFFRATGARRGGGFCLRPDRESQLDQTADGFGPSRMIMCAAAHVSTFVTNSSDSLMVRTGSRPVAGLPPLLGFGNTAPDLGMLWYYYRSNADPVSPLRWIVAASPLGEKATESVDTSL
jgi:hypothetical protein